MTAPAVALLHRTFPCCGGKSRIAEDCAKTLYERTCRRCGVAWTVRRVTRPASAFSERMGTRFDALEWERM